MYHKSLHFICQIDEDIVTYETFIYLRNEYRNRDVIFPTPEVAIQRICLPT